ncbi:hypothetical protein JCM10213v2_001682 [Rhodosporidiobolus nylandii]
MPALYDSREPPARHPAAFNLPRGSRTLYSIGKGRRGGYEQASGSSDYGSSASESESEDEGEGGTRHREPAPRPSNANNMLMLAIVGVLALIAVVGTLLYFHMQSDESASSVDSSSGNAGSASTRRVTATVPSSPSPPTAAFTASKPGLSTTAASALPSSSSSLSASSASSTSGSSSSAGDGAGSGLFGVSDNVCGDSGAVDEPVAGGGPNGAQAWLNCGLSKDKPDGKWTPPHIEISQLKSVALDDALQLEVFSNCKQFEDAFQAASDANGVPAILSDKCDGAPSGDCADPAFNINRGAEYFVSLLKEQYGGSTLLALGNYNGWYEGLTYNKATEAGKDQSTCVYQNNLDYFQVILNGYMMGVDGQQLATIKNLAICDGDR